MEGDTYIGESLYVVLEAAKHGDENLAQVADSHHPLCIYLGLLDEDDRADRFAQLNGVVMWLGWG